jgi:hypothetical protein
MARVTPYAYVLPGDYDAYLELCDGHLNLPATHTGYLLHIHDQCARIRIKGFEPAEVRCKPLDIALWCHKHGCLPDGPSIGRYAVERYEQEWQ